MRHIEIPIPKSADDAEIERAIDLAIDRTGLQISLRDTLKKHPGCVHWHVRSGRESGTLEITFWPVEHRTWFTVQSGRTSPWIDAMIPRLRTAIGNGIG